MSSQCDSPSPHTVSGCRSCTKISSCSIGTLLEANIPKIEVVDTVFAKLNFNALIQCRNFRLQTLKLGAPQSVRCPINLSVYHRSSK